MVKEIYPEKSSPMVLLQIEVISPIVAVDDLAPQLSLLRHSTTIPPCRTCHQSPSPPQPAIIQASYLPDSIPAMSTGWVATRPISNHRQANVNARTNTTNGSKTFPYFPPTHIIAISPITAACLSFLRLYLTYTFSTTLTTTIEQSARSPANSEMNKTQPSQHNSCEHFRLGFVL